MCADIDIDYECASATTYMQQDIYMEEVEREGIVASEPQPYITTIFQADPLIIIPSIACLGNEFSHV